MNFQLMHLQKKLVLIAAAAGLIAMFLPWVNISAFGMDVGQNTNGLKGSGMLLFFLFLVCGLLCLSGKNQEPLTLFNWFIAQILALVLVLTMSLGSINTSAGGLDGMGIVEATPGIGFWLAAIAIICLNVFLWLYKVKGYTIKSGLELAKGKFGNHANQQPTIPPVDKDNHPFHALEKLIQLKKDGMIDEEEFIKLKKRI